MPAEGVNRRRGRRPAVADITGKTVTTLGLTARLSGKFPTETDARLGAAPTALAVAAEVPATPLGVVGLDDRRRTSSSASATHHVRDTLAPTFPLAASAILVTAARTYPAADERV